MPEPLLEESITDIDRSGAGELEFDLTSAVHPTATRGVRLWANSIEAEWGVTRNLGLALEIEGATGIGPNSAAVPFDWSLRGGVAWALLHDFARDIHLQLEATGSLMREQNELADFEESRRPFGLDLRAGARQGRWTGRAGLGVGIGGTGAPSLPVRGSIALFGELRPLISIGFIGVEVDADASQKHPVTLAPTIVLGWPRIRLGSALVSHVTGNGLSFGVMARLIYEPD